MLNKYLFNTNNKGHRYLNLFIMRIVHLGMSGMSPSVHCRVKPHFLLRIGIKEAMLSKLKLLGTLILSLLYVLYISVVSLANVTHTTGKMIQRYIQGASSAPDEAEHVIH